MSVFIPLPGISGFRLGVNLKLVLVTSWGNFGKVSNS